MTDEQPQHMRALKSANTIRLANADLHRRLRAMTRRSAYHLLAELLNALAENDDQAFVEHDVDRPAFERLRVDLALKYCHRTGPSTITKALRASGVYAENKRMAELTRRQQEALAHVLENPRLFAPHSHSTLGGEAAA